MNNFSLLTRFILVVSFLSLASCDDEFNEVGSDVIGGDIHNNITRMQPSLLAYDKATGPVQTNNLDLNALGVYDNPVFGKTKAHYITQIQLDSENPTFTSDVVLDSVWLYIPYYSTLTNTDTDGHSTYTIDSIYGDTLQKFRLSIKENGYYLRDADATSSGGIGQKYYNTDKETFDSYAGVSLLENSDPFIDWRYSAAEIRRTATYTNDDGEVQTNAEVELKAPGMFINLNKTYFQQKILNAGGSGNLINNNVFRNYIRGLYFEAQQIGNQSVMGAINFDAGDITIIYTQNDLDANGNTQPDPDNTGALLKEKKELVISLGGNSVNLLESDNSPAYNAALASANTTEGDSRLYAKGGQGSFVFLDILTPDEILQLQNEQAMINEANLVFYVDRSAMGITGTTGRQAIEPKRVYLYDVNNKRPLVDYGNDGTVNAADKKYDKYVHGGIAQVSADGRAVQYKIRITGHINNIITKDSTNVKLALVVTEDIKQTGNAALKNAFTEPKYNPRTIGDIIDPANINVRTVPVSSVVHPFGTIFYGTSPDVPEEKRARLEIFYTKPNTTE